MAVTMSISCTQNSQNIANNTSNVTVKAVLKWTYGSWNGDDRSGSITVNGNTWTFSKPFNTSGSTSGSQTIATVTTNVPHNSDGKKTVSYSAKYSTGLSSGTVSASGSKTLTTIPRQATLTSAPNFNDEANPVIKYSNPAGSSVSALETGIFTTDGMGTYAAYRSITKTASSYTFNLTNTERKLLRQACKTSNSMNVRYYLKTTIGSNVYRHYLTKTFSIINAEPTLNPTIIDTNVISQQLTGNDPETIIKGLNTIVCTYNAAALKEAELTKLNITVGTKSVTESRTVGSNIVLPASSILENIDNGKITVTVTDSRGNATSTIIEKQLIEYVPLTCEFMNGRPTADGEMLFTIAGNYFNGRFGDLEEAQNNTLKVEWRYKENNGEYCEWNLVTPTITDNTYVYTNTLTGLNYQSIYTFQARAQDKVNELNSTYIETEEIRVKCQPVFDWGEDDFAFNVPVVLNEGLTSIVLEAGTDLNEVMKPNFYSGGSYEEYGYLNTPITDAVSTFDLEVIACGNGGQLKQIITKCDKNAPVSYTRHYYSGSWGDWTLSHGKVQKYLWSGVLYMRDTQTINLNEPISKQKQGIILMFSGYANGVAQNYNWSTVFIPKRWILEYEAGSGAGFSCLIGGTTGITSYKYLYIYDDKIVGHANNIGSKTLNGITYNNSSTVLRRVVGV